MTTEEVKREHREIGRRPAPQGQAAPEDEADGEAGACRPRSRRPTSAIVNPTHYAVALRYDDKQDAAPVVVAKGVDEYAAKIREVARRARRAQC